MQARIIINFPEEKYSALTKFTQIVEVISDWKNSEPIFQGIKVENKESMNYLVKKRIDLEAIDIAKYIKDYDHPDNLFASGVGFKCWRFKEGEAKRGYSRIDIDVWGTGHEMYKKNDVAVEGLCWLYLNHSGPFCAVVGEKKMSTGNQIKRWLKI